MEYTPLEIQMLGGASIRRGGVETGIASRSQKLCLLLSYLIWQRRRPVPSEELAGVIWKDKPLDSGTFNALKALLYRARACLDQLEEGAGRALILSREGGYQWNPDQPVSLDAEEFTRLCQKGKAAKSEERRLAAWLKALALYRGDFLPALRGHPWAAPICAQLHQAYLDAALQALPLLSARSRDQEAAELAGAVFALEPMREDLCRWRMETLLRLDRRQQAARVYEEFQERLLTRLGVMPSDGLCELYREAQRLHDPRAVSPVTLLERLQEPPSSGALLCEYDFFRTICYSMVRMSGRSGLPLHIALISVQPARDVPLPRHSLDRAMNHLQETICQNLRRGDTAARCSASQFVLLLPQASYENSQMVCRRITRAFVRQFPHSPAVLRVSVQPLLPQVKA